MLGLSNLLLSAGFVRLRNLAVFRGFRGGGRIPKLCIAASIEASAGLDGRMSFPALASRYPCPMPGERYFNKPKIIGFTAGSSGIQVRCRVEIANAALKGHSTQRIRTPASDLSQRQHVVTQPLEAARVIRLCSTRTPALDTYSQARCDHIPASSVSSACRTR